MNAPLYSDGYEDELRAVDKDGCVAVPSGAGLGVEYDLGVDREETTSGGP